jgi:hypothetical protein
VRAPGHNYQVQAQRRLAMLMKEAGVSSVDEIWRKAREEHRLWMYLTEKPTA